jgi:hypothetical protein
MDLSQWFNDQLKSSADGFVWAVEQVPVERRLVSPPAPLGEWNAARHVFHMLYYEQMIALPAMQQWLGEPFTLTGEDFNEDETWGDGKNLETILADFRKIRAEQIVLLPQFAESMWNETRDTVWGKVTLQWVVTKTFQHTAEHTHDVLRMALFWDMIVLHLQQKGE